MGFRFRRSVKIIPGLRVNFSNSGVSTSVGVRGAHVTIGHGKVRETVGIPGTGLSYTEVQSTKPGAHESVAAPPLSDTERMTIKLQIFWALVLIVGFAVLVQVFVAFTTY